jgi:hypothetical protein
MLLSVIALRFRFESAASILAFFACMHQFGLIFDARFPVCFTILFSHCSFVEKMPRIPYAIDACLPLRVCNLIHTKTAVTCPCLTWSS